MAAVLRFRKRQEDDLLVSCFFDLVGLSSSGRLRRLTPLGNQAWRLSDRVGFGRAQPCFFLTVWFQRKRREAQQSVAIGDMPFCFPVKSECGEGHGGLDFKTSNGGSIPGGVEEFAW